MILNPPSSVAFSVFGYDIKFYGIMLFLGMIFGIFTTSVISKRYYKSVDLDILTDFMPFLIIFSILGARIYYVLLSFNYYVKFPQEIFALWHGGISIHGAILGGLIAGVIYFKFIKKIPLLPYADVVSYGLAIGQAIGRWGNFFNQEAFGIPCNLPWKLYVEPIYRPAELMQYSYFHPAFMYESIWDVFVFLILFFVVRKWAKNLSGVVFFSYLALYSTGRIFIENIRTDSVLNVQNIPIALIVSVFTILISIFSLIFITLQNKKPVN